MIKKISIALMLVFIFSNSAFSTWSGKRNLRWIQVDECVSGEWYVLFQCDADPDQRLFYFKIDGTPQKDYWFALLNSAKTAIHRIEYETDGTLKSFCGFTGAYEVTQLRAWDNE